MCSRLCILECVLGISGLYLVFGGMKLVYEGMLWHWFLYFICGGVFLYFVRISFACVGMFCIWDSVFCIWYFGLCV